MHRDAKYNPETKKATFSHNSHYGETLPNTEVNNNAPKALGQDLATDSAMSVAAKFVRSYQQQKH